MLNGGLVKKLPINPRRPYAGAAIILNLTQTLHPPHPLPPCSGQLQLKTTPIRNAINSLTFYDPMQSKKVLG